MVCTRTCLVYVLNIDHGANKHVYLAREHLINNSVL